jgi:RNA polymerase sigma-70 factor (ECF subfamily)
MKELYQRYSGMLYSFACHMVSDQEVAEDILQDAFLAIWQCASSYSSRSGAARSWLIDMLRRRAIDSPRSFHRSTLKEAQFAEGEPEVYLNRASREPEPWEVVCHTVKAEQVQTALFQLHSEERLVLELAFFQHQTSIEIAKGIQMPLSTVKARMRQGIHRLKGILEGMMLDEEGSSLSH